MSENRIDLINFADIVGHTSDCLDVLAGDALYVSDLVSDVLLDGEAPECNYEDFVDFCDGCGVTIKKGDEYVVEDDAHLCADCAHIETADGEQMELPIDETADETDA